MPSSYRSYAVNFSGNPRVDLSHNVPDIIGSIANYYKKNGWEMDQPVAIPASMAGGKYQFSFTDPKPISLSELIEYGIIRGNNFSADKKIRFMVLQANYGNEYWLCFHNFDVIKRYNHSDLYAMAVYQLSYYITALREDTLNDNANEKTTM